MGDNELMLWPTPLWMPEVDGKDVPASTNWMTNDGVNYD